MTRNEAKDRVVEAARKVQYFPKFGQAGVWAKDFIELNDALAALNSTPDSGGGWRPIAEMSKDDETVVDVWQVVSQRGEMLYEARKPNALRFQDAWTSDDTGELLEWEEEGEDGRCAVISHYRPLPAPPSQEQK